MKYQIIGKNIEVTEGIREAVESKLSRMDKYFVIKDDVTCRVVVRSYKVGSKIEITIFTPMMDFRAEVAHEDLYAGVDLAIDKLEGQMRKLKTRMDRSKGGKVSLGKAIAFENLEAIEEEIAEDYGLDKDYVFINIAEYPRFDEMKTQVNVDGKLYPLTEISNIIGALSKARFNIPDISVYVKEEEKSKFKKFKLENYLELPEIDREKFHGIHYDQIKLF